MKHSTRRRIWNDFKLAVMIWLIALVASCYTATMMQSRCCQQEASQPDFSKQQEKIRISLDPLVYYEVK